MAFFPTDTWLDSGFIASHYSLTFLANHMPTSSLANWTADLAT